MSNSNISVFIREAKVKSVKKGEILMSAGEITDCFFYVQKGCLRSYTIDTKGKEHIYQFAPEDWIVSDEVAIAEKTAAIFFIDAIEDSEIKVLKMPWANGSKDLDKESLIEINEKFNKKIISLRRRILQLLSSSAEERYNEFIKVYPGLTQRVPLKMIASYLGITPESLSRVRKDIVTKK